MKTLSDMAFVRQHAIVLAESLADLAAAERNTPAAAAMAKARDAARECAEQVARAIEAKDKA